MAKAEVATEASLIPEAYFVGVKAYEAQSLRKQANDRARGRTDSELGQDIDLR